MDALSALKLVTGPQTGVFTANALQNTAAANTISPAELQSLTSANSDSPVQSTSSAKGGDFENMLGDLVNDVAQKQATAQGTVNGMLSGQNVSLHQAMISMEEANVSFQMMVEVRNRLMDGYQELMRMQI